MKIRYALNTPWPTDVPGRNGLESADWFKHGDIPFLPVAGMLIDCGDGDCRDVQKVYWCATEPDEVEVFFKDETARNLDYWTRGGWQTNDLAPPVPSSKVRKVAARAAPLKGANQ